MDLAPGVHVTDNIRLKRRLGEGGMASVWVAEHLTLHVDVAVKFISPELVGSAPDLVARFNREAMAIARIRSPHVVQILDHGMTADGTPYIVMELLEGEDLGMRLDRDGQLPMAQVVEIVSQVAKALTRAHAVGIIHRDIKPDNIFLCHADDDEIFVKVLDFGIAKHTKKTSQSVVTTTGTMVGTPAYMSPEQVLSGKHVDERADLWSLAVVAYHALTGDVPFQGNTLGALCVAISRGTFQAASYIEPSLPSAIDAWMSRALSLPPEARFPNAKEFADALREAAASGPVASDDVGPFSRPSFDALAGREGSGWDEESPSSRRRARTNALAQESRIILPTKRLVSPLALGGSVALVGGVLAVAALTRTPHGGEPHAASSPAEVGAVLEAPTAERMGPASMASSDAASAPETQSQARAEVAPATSGATPEAEDAKPASPRRPGKIRGREAKSRSVVTEEAATVDMPDTPVDGARVPHTTTPATPIDRGF